MDRLLWRGRAGIRILDFTYRDQVSLLALASNRLSLADLGGDGTTGDLTGITTTSFTTTTPTFREAESSSIATTSIAGMQVSIMPAGFVAETDFMAGARAGVEVLVGLRSRMDLWRHMLSLAPIPAHSAALITEELREDFRLAADRASVEGSTEAEAFMEVEVTEAEVTDESVPLLQDN